MLQTSKNLSNSKSITGLARRHHPALVSIMFLVMLALIAITAIRTVASYSRPATEFDWENRGHSDFHNGAYFPSRAFLDGRSPYSQTVATEYFMSRASPTFSPVVFAIHVPFALLPLPQADIAFFIFNLLLMAALAYSCIAMSQQPFRWFDFLGITNLLLLSRPGHITLFSGYFTAEILLGCLIALHFAKSRPVVSGLGLVLASIKPNFAIPLIIILLFRRNFRAATLGIVFCTIAGSAGIGWLSYHNGFEQVVQDIRGGQKALHVDPTEMPVNTWTRVDLVGMYAKLVDWVPGDSVYLIAMLIFMTLIGIVVTRVVSLESNSGATGLTAFIAILAILLGVYHQAYDCLMLSVPAVGVLFYGERTLREVPKFWRMVVALLVAVPAVNYVSTITVMKILSVEQLSPLWQSLTLINGVCLTLALIILLIVAISLDQTKSRIGLPISGSKGRNPLSAGHKKR